MNIILVPKMEVANFKLFFIHFRSQEKPQQTVMHIIYTLRSANMLQNKKK
jgi:hypothetical protein